jgi:hypothetical protein
MSVRCDYLLFTFALLMVAGCRSSSVDGQPNASSENLQQLARWYASFPSTNNGRLPANENEFKQHINSQGGESVDEMFVSERDNQPFVVLYGRDAVNPVNSGIVAFEKQGLEGKRLVAYRSGSTEEVDDARFRELVRKPPQ